MVDSSVIADIVDGLVVVIYSVFAVSSVPDVVITVVAQLEIHSDKSTPRPDSISSNVIV